MKIAILLGTRPEIIKMSPVINECRRRDIEYIIIHSGQHYSYNMDKIFFEQLGLPTPKYRLEVGSGSHAVQTGIIMARLEKVLSNDRPEVVLVQGDTNTVLAGALTAAKMHVMVGHLEAGLRSYDKLMPEEINRKVADHCSDFLFAPTRKAAEILTHEGIQSERIFETGNTIVDAIYQNSNQLDSSNILNKLSINENGYFLVTVHRQENVDDFHRLEKIMITLELIQKEYSIPVIFPIHPRSLKMIKMYNIRHDRISLIEPLDFFSFISLESKARLILTDSGGVQEEACVLKVPCVTLRDNTERPETIDNGANILAGIEPKKISESVQIMLKRDRHWQNPFGNGRASVKIIQNLEKMLQL